MLLFLSICLRFYKTSDLFVFSGDEEHQLSIAQTIVKNFHIEWVGVSSADTGFYLGPFWEYFGAFWLFLSKGNPEIVAYIASFIGVVTTLLVYFTGRLLFGEIVGIIGGFLYSTLPLLAYYDRKFWNPALTSLTSLVLIFSLFKTKDSPKWWILVAFMYGMVFHVHLSLVPLGLVILYWFCKKNYKVTRKLIFICILVFLLTVSPLIGFDYFHKFSNLQTPIRVINSVRNTPSRLDPFGNMKQLFISLGRLWYLSPFRSNSDEVLHSCSPNFTNKRLHQVGITTTTSGNFFLLSVFSFGLLAWFFLRPLTWKKENTKLLSLFLLTIIISYIFLPNVPLEYYLLGIFPLFLFLPAILLQSFKGFIKIGFLLFLLALSLSGIFTVLTATDQYGLSVKHKLIAKVASFVGEKKYELIAEGLCHKYEGWRFLFNAYAKKPERSFSDSTLGWLYRDEITKDKVDYKVLVSEARIADKIPGGYKAVISEGGFKAYIY